MKVADLFKALSYGDLSNSSIAVEATGTIKEEYHPQIIQFANDALLRIYTHFLLLRKSVFIVQDKDIHLYPLRPGEPFIEDLDFEGDVIRILGVYNAFGQPLPLDDTRNPKSMSTPQAHVLHIPEPEHGCRLEIEYQARHPILDPKDFDQEIEIPVGLEEALKAYIAHRVFAGINTPEAIQASTAHLTRFQSILADGEQAGWINTNSIAGKNSKFEARGWV